MDNFLTYDDAYTLIEKIGSVLPQKATLPTASADWVGKIVQYTGEDASGLGYDLINGHWYKCESWGTGYIWTDLYADSVNNSSKPVISSAVNSALQNKQNIIQVAEMPTASSARVGDILQYIGTTTASYTNGYFYKCVAGSTSGTYEWTPVVVQKGGSGSIQSDWNETDTTADDYIKNKPTLGSAAALDVATSGNASSSQVVKGNDSRLTDSRTPTNHASNKVTSLTGYTKSISGTLPISTSDTLNKALAKLENAVGSGSGNSIQVNTLPIASASNLGKIYQYIGTTTPNRRNGFFYKCVAGDVAGTYEWVNIDVQYGGIGGENHVYYDPIPEHTYLYGFDIHTLDSNPDTRVTYPLDVDNANYSPAYMNFTNNTFKYGSWNLSPGQHFMPRPCMLYTNCTVAYYLNPNDYTKKATGEKSDVASQSFDGNAMMEWNKIYTYREMDHNGTYRFRCSDVKLGPNWECWCNYDSGNKVISHFYTRIYGGYVYSDKLRSISGKTLTGKQTLSGWVLRASNTGVSYYTDVLVDRLLINDLLVLMAKNTDIVGKFGDGSTTLSHSTGTLNTKGMFWGTNDLKTGVKIFGMEDYWGNFEAVSPTLCSKRDDDGHATLYYKITRGTKDGSTASNYNTTGEGYLPLYRFSDNLSGYISEMVVTPYGRFPRGADGSSSEYECSKFVFGANNRECIAFGNYGASSNPFYMITVSSSSVNQSDSYIACLSCKPLAPVTN